MSRSTPLQYTALKSGAFIIALSGLACSAVAEDAHLADKALHCSSVMTALKASQSKGDDLYHRLENAASIFMDVYRKASVTSDTKNERAPRSSLPSDVDALLQEPVLDVVAFREDAVVCGAWAEGFLAQGKQVLYIPVFPKIVGAQVRKLYQSLADRRLQQQVPKTAR